MPRISASALLILVLTACPAKEADTGASTGTGAGTGSGTSAGQTEGGTDEGGDRGSCDDYIDCIGAVLPDTHEQAKAAYGPASACWNTSPEVEKGCLDACAAGLMALGLTYPDEPLCGGAGSTTTPTSSASASDPSTTADPSDSDPSDTAPTSDEPLTSDPSDSDSDPSDSDPSDSDPSDTAGNYGNCGWDAGNNWYGCSGVPGLVDPDGISPIECPPNLQAGGPCSEQNGPITGAGCCMPNTDNYYCARGSIFVETCGF